MSVSLLQLWMPILLGGALAWFASGIIHMALPYHKSDYKQLPNEEDVTNAIRKGSLGTGIYTFPFCSDMKEMGSDSTKEKFNKGPVGMLTMFPNGIPQMGKLMGQQIAFFIIGTTLIAYCASLALAPGTDYMVVFRTISAISFLAFGWALIPYSIWYGHPWAVTFKYMFDALVYALILAGVFGWLWPGVA